MTIDEFMMELSELKDLGWHNDPIYGGIRTKASEYKSSCPIEAVHQEKTGEKPSCGFLPAGIALGLSGDDAVAIAVAADKDSKDERYDYNLRRRLRRATGLAK